MGIFKWMFGGFGRPWKTFDEFLSDRWLGGVDGFFLTFFV